MIFIVILYQTEVCIQRTVQTCCALIQEKEDKVNSLLFHWRVQNATIPCRFSGASSIPLCYVLFPATLLHQLFFHPLSPHLTIYFLVYLSILSFPNSYIILFREFYFLPFSVHAQTNVIYLTFQRDKVNAENKCPCPDRGTGRTII